VTATQIDQYLKGKGSPLAGYGKNFVASGRRYGVSPALLVAIAGAESSFGKIESGTNNSWGWGPGIDFASREAGIDTVAKGLKNGYLSQGRRSITAIGAKYAPGNAANDPTGLNSNWAKNVTKFYKELGAGGLLTAPQSGAPPQTDPSAADAPALPDLSAAALTSLGRTAARRQSPQEDLSDLVASVSAAGPAPSQAAPMAPPNVSIKVNTKSTPRVKGAVALVQEYLGTPYVWGGENPGGFDCSGLLQYVWGKQGVQIPRVTYDQWRTGQAVSKSQLRAGDAVFFRPGSRGPEHVGMYIGGGKFIEAPGRGKHVRISELGGRSGYMGARRFA
jgi:cell wall-associated NlpC family hydrolase